MTPKGLKPNDMVRVNKCEGFARIVGYLASYGVFVLDRQMHRKFVDKLNGDAIYVPYWTFEPKDLKKVELTRKNARLWRIL